MIHYSSKTATPRAARPADRARQWGLKLLHRALARPRLISNLLALVALFSVGFV